LSLSYQIIYLGGPSSSGKTVLAEELQQVLVEPFLRIGIDTMIDMMPAKLNHWTGEVATEGFYWKRSMDGEGNLVLDLEMGPFAERVCNAFVDVVIALARGGHFVIVDDVPLEQSQLEVWKQRLQEFRVLYVGLTAPISVLEQREARREDDRTVGSARGQLLRSSKELGYDLVLDTSEMSLSHEVEAILKWF
jgi:chloramphenicol 3-O phosphotransferase